MKKSGGIISHKARTSLKGHIQYLKEHVSEEVAKHVSRGILNKCKTLKDFSGYSIERYLEGIPG